MNNVNTMIDIETLDTSPTAVILAIGACTFDPTSDSAMNTFEIHINPNQPGRTISADTVMWWLEQSKEAQNALTAKTRVPLQQALKEFALWVSNQYPKSPRVWAKDPDFDCTILQNAFKQYGVTWPWKFYETRSVRTIQELAWPNNDAPKFVELAHSALADAIGQARLVQTAFKKLA